MPIVLMQKAWRDDPKYKDTEFVVYHYPRIYVEVKSLSRPASTVDRMRYGMGQLFDYAVRYKADIAGARPVLASGAMLREDVAWVAEILEGNDVAFVARDGSAVKPVNAIARRLPIFS